MGTHGSEKTRLWSTRLKPACSFVRQIAFVCLTLLLTLAISGCAGLEEAIDELTLVAQDFEDEPARPSPTLIINACEQCCAFIFSAGSQAYDDALLCYAQGRVVEMNYADRDPVLFSAWTAKEDLGAAEADPDGRLTLWDDDYFVTHTWSFYGTRILTMVPGDNVEINNRILNVRGIFDYPKAAYNDEIRALVGYDTVIIQTCEPDSDLNRIVYGVWTES